MRRSFIVLLALAAGVIVGASDVSAQARKWGEGYIPNVPVVDQDGKSLRFYDDVIRGKIVVISFVYTSCKDICPLLTARLAQVAGLLGDKMGRDVYFVSLSVDPVNDTPAKLKEHAAAFHAGAGWTFLTGTLDDIRLINGRLGEKMRSLSEHRTEIVLGNDETGEWARNSVFGDINRLVMDIRAMDPKWRNQVHAAGSGQSADARFNIAARPGQALFKRMCSACHAFKVADNIGPDLYGVTRRRTRRWLVDFIMSPEKMLRQNDPTAVALARKFPGAKMPNLGLTETDAADLVEYLESQSNLLDTERRKAEKALPANHRHDEHSHDHKDHRH